MPVKFNHDVKLHYDDPAGVIISMLGTWEGIKFSSQRLLNSTTADDLIPHLSVLIHKLFKSPNQLL